MKQKGFTLIELLAILIILALLALIATPMIMSIVASVKESAMKENVLSIQNAARLFLLNEKGSDPHYEFKMEDFKYDGEQYGDNINIALNEDDQAGVAVYKDNVCYYVEAGSRKSIVDKKIDKGTCLKKLDHLH